MTTTCAQRVAALVAAAALAGGASACTSANADDPGIASTGGPAHVRTHSKVLHFVSTPEKGNMAMADLGPKSKPGEQDIADLIVFTERLSQGGKTVGQIHVAGIGVDHRRMLSQTSATLKLANGTVEVAGLVPKAPRFRLAVVGGTGSYVGAAGTLLLDFTGKQERLTLTVRR